MHTENANYVLIAYSSCFRHFFFPHSDELGSRLSGVASYASLKADITAWLPKITLGGWLSGDDYDQLKWPEVVKAVADLLPGAKSWSTQQWRWIVTWACAALTLLSVPRPRAG
jgi:hypothetical protein